jgi:hypothetical protein
MKVAGFIVLLLLVALYVFRRNSLNTLITAIAWAIAKAEGAKPEINNPGDLKIDTIGKGTGKDARGFIIYASFADGFEALRQQVYLMLTNQSKIYKNTDTIAQVGAKYTTTAQSAWVQIVSSALKVSPNTRLIDVTV